MDRYQQLFDGPCDEIDAAVFSGDLLEDKKRLARFKELVERWGRAIAEREAREE